MPCMHVVVKDTCHANAITTLQQIYAAAVTDGIADVVENAQKYVHRHFWWKHTTDQRKY